MKDIIEILLNLFVLVVVLGFGIGVFLLFGYIFNQLAQQFPTTSPAANALNAATWILIFLEIFVIILIISILAYTLLKILGVI
jgi:hypothetical protein